MSRARLLHLLDEQLEFIDSSCAGFDQGIEAECKRLATHIRTLVYDTSRSKSLLAHLGVKERLQYYDPMIEVHAHMEEVRARGGISIETALVAVAFSKSGTVRYVPRALGDALSGIGKSSFADWWLGKALLPVHGDPPNRRQLVWWLANKEGGAHVDGKLPPSYVDLTTGSAMGMTFSNPEAQNSPIPCAVRQIAEELRRSVREQHHLIEAG